MTTPLQLILKEDFLRLLDNSQEPEQEKAPARIFLKIGAWPIAYKKNVDDASVIAILETLLTFKFETFVNAEFIYSLNVLKSY